MVDPYVYPGTAVLQNKPGFRDQAELDRFERFAVSLREGTLRVSDRDLHGTAAPAIIHRHLFQDTYAWAGEHRTVDISKGNNFLPVSRIDLGLGEVKRRLQASASPEMLAELKRAQQAGAPGTPEAFAAAIAGPTASSTTCTHSARATAA